MSHTLRVACGRCHTINRLPADRLSDRPICGNCRQSLFTGEPMELGIDNADAHLQRSDLPVLVDFWAPWCGPCKMMAPQFAQAAGQLEPQMQLAKINTQVEPTLGQRYGIRSIPTMILFQRGRELARSSGAMPAAAIVNWARQAAAHGD